MITCTPALSTFRNGSGLNGSSPASRALPPRETCPGVPDRLLRAADADRVFEARVRWFLDVSRNA